MAKRELIGKIVDTSGRPQVGTEVWLSAAGVATAEGKTGDGGKFVLQLGDEFKAGGYRLEALSTAGALGAGRNVQLTESGPPAQVELTVPSRDSVSAVAGWIFLLATPSGTPTDVGGSPIATPYGSGRYGMAEKC